uniref:Uncharacterized protein n=1 Tax=Anguilla anguilla TaxID=7936 RepID=A0A0E9QJ64_ANGAN
MAFILIMYTFIILGTCCPLGYSLYKERFHF